MTTNQSSSVLATILLALTAVTPLRADLTIVPGKRIGDIALGMERAEVLRQLGTPQREDVLVNGNDENSPDTFKPPRSLPVEKTSNGDQLGVLRDDWVASGPIKDAPFFLGQFVTVYYLNRRVVQIEVSSAEFKTEDQLSTKDAAPQFRKVYPHFTKTAGRSQIPRSFIETKHYVMIEDAAEAGIAWRYGTTGNMGEDPDETGEVEVITVHAAGKEMVFDPDNDCRFLWKDNPSGLSTDR